MWPLVILTLTCIPGPLLIQGAPENSSRVYAVRVDHRGNPYPRHQQFRHKGQVPWYGKTHYRLQSVKNSSLGQWTLELRPYYPLHRLLKSSNSTLEARTALQSGCYYKGRVLGMMFSSVKVSLCEGMTGDIHTSSESYVIHPIFNVANASSHSLLPHHLSPLEYPDPSRPWRPLVAKGVHFCDVEDDSFNHEKQEQLLNQSESPTNSSHLLVRKKRSESRELHLEVLVVADSKMAKYHGSNLNHYILTLMSTVALIYKDPSIGNNINIAVVDIIVLNESANHDVVHHIAPITLRKFCRWQQRNNKLDDRDPAHYDTAILITREDLCRYPGACDTLGLAQSGMVCDSYSSCAIVEDNGLSAAFTIAHELGHVMNIPHDDDNKCARYHNEKKKLHVMARMLDYNSSPWSWSACSREYLTTFFDVGYGHCLMDKPGRNRLTQDDEFQQAPGQLYPRDRQCELVFGPRSRICPYMPECKRLWCTMEDSTQGGCRTQHMPWADGTQCSDKKRCFQGECVRYRPAGLTPVDGEWGKWKPYGKCSRTCGGGVEQAFRECNSPKPANGGRYCTGIRVRYKSCNIQECPDITSDFRAEQCAEFNGRDLNVPGVPQTAEWVPQYNTITPHDKCKLYCKVKGSASYFVLREKVIDGTPCELGGFDICVNGNCEPAGCDHALHSKKALDRCGVCGGDNSTCKDITGHFNRKVDYGYHSVVLIPPGAINVHIQQNSLDDNVDDNYIALKDPDGTYVLNGEFMITMFPKKLQYHGITIDYSGSNSVIEYVNSSKPLPKDLFVQVLVVGKLQPPSITFSYTVPLSQNKLYTWKLATQYSECSRLCNGISVLKPVCIRLSDQYPVHEHHCAELSKPSSPKVRKCNEHCQLKWESISTHTSKCSVQCGIGVRYRIIKCMKEEISTKISHAVPEEHCMHLGSKPSSEEKCRGDCFNSSWRYSEWSDCSVTCGKGTRFRSAECRNSKNGKEPDSHCDSSSLVVSEICEERSCPEWGVGEWTECSVTCGTGIRQRLLRCQQGEKYVDPRYCSGEMPAAEEVCYPGDCYEWVELDWKPCSVTCGEGLTKRIVYCSSSTKHEVEDSYCIHLPRPLTIKNCSTSISCADPISYFPRTNDEESSPSSRILSDTNAISEYRRAIWKTGEWSKCLTTCGEGFRRRTVTCHNSADDSRLALSHCDSRTKPKTSEKCIEEKCLQWEVGDWSECSVTCGGGIKRRQVLCYNEDGASSDSCDISVKPPEMSECNTHHCPGWVMGEWGECSVTCGKGTRIRAVECISYDGKRELEQLCKAERKPDGEEICMIQTCAQELNYKWLDGPWSECSATCGNGIQQRNVYCLNSQGHHENPEKCLEPPPPRTRSCNLGICPMWKWSEWSQCPRSCGFYEQQRYPHCVRGERMVSEEDCFESKPAPERRQCKIPVECSFKWRKGTWSQCHASCGSAFKVREVFCIDHERNRVADEFCSSRQPKKRKKCDLKPCPYSWKVGHWSECSKTCDEGFHRRSVTCHAVNAYGWINPEPAHSSHCDPSRKPKDMERCKYGACSSGFSWRPEPWQPCEGPCHNAKQKRKLRCYTLQGIRVSNNKCDKSLKPRKRRKCSNTHECPPKSCLDLHNFQNKRQDGDYEIQIKGKMVTVYCHDMQTVYPQEYISLRDNTNYAMIHSPSLSNQFGSSDSCLNNDIVHTCDCNRKDYGYTIFFKVAFNVTSLKIIIDDFRFSNTYYGKPVPFATAGDCIRRPNCLLGVFSISLEGSDFRIAPSTRWVSRGHRGHATIHRTNNDQVIRGKCGGFCDTCMPDPHNGLSIDVLMPS